MKIDLPAELGQRLKAAKDIDADAVCAAALERALDYQAALAEADDGMERVELFLERDGRDVAFIGRLLWCSDTHELSVYLTRRHRFAACDEHTLRDVDTLDELAEVTSDEIAADVASALGGTRFIELDI